MVKPSDSPAPAPAPAPAPSPPEPCSGRYDYGERPGTVHDNIRTDVTLNHPAPPPPPPPKD